MCGIAGIFDLHGQRDIDLSLLKRMTRTLEHRGPDGEGFHIEPGVGLGHRRLAIIDIEGGKQPLFNEDQTVSVTYNGEIYNFKVLQSELEALGHVFRTRCDTEVIVHAWEEWGESCVDRFNGMFAFAIFDRNKKCLFIARDRIGIKPVYYGMTSDGYLLFASELKAIMSSQSVSRELRVDAVEDYFAFGYVPDPKTIVKNVHKLPPGHTMCVRVGQGIPSTRKYWDVPFSEDESCSRATSTSEIADRLMDSVEKRLISEVPLGAFLSGGVDSSAVVAMMARLNSSRLNTMCISFGDPRFNESHFADMVSSKYDTNHMVQQVDPSDFDLVAQLPKIYDEPFADSSAIPTYRVCEMARKHVTVALSGDGGDENFVGYRRYRWHAYEERVRDLLPQSLRQAVFGTIGAVYPKLDWAPKVLRAKSTLQAVARDSIDGYMHSVSISTGVLRREIYDTDFLNSLEGYEATEVFREHAANIPKLTGTKLAQYLDFKTYLPGDILTKVDRASMANSLEVRVPILDHEFVEWVAKIPTREKLDGREGKACFKESLKPFLPDEILYRDKMGFGVPLADWFRGPLRADVDTAINEGSLATSGVFNSQALRRLQKQHQSGSRDHSAILWALLVFGGSYDNLFGTAN